MYNRDMRYTAPHEVSGEAKLAAIVSALEAGQTIPPIAVLTNGYAVSGSHRIAACEIAGVDCPAVVVSDEDATAAAEYMGLDSVLDCSDFNEICHAIYAVTEDADLRKALEDQRG